MIEVSDMSFRYREGASCAVADVNLRIPDGAFVGVTGPAGSGKSTLTYALNGIVPHCYPGDFYGSVRIDGVDTVDAGLSDISRLVGSVCQDIDSQMVASVVEDEVLYGMENFGVPKSEIESRLQRVLEEMGIVDLRDRTIDSLSGGQKQKVAIASVIALEPRVLVLDEPFESVDPVSSANLKDILIEYARTGGTVIISSHVMALVEKMCTHVAVINQGQVCAAGTVEEVAAGEDLEDRFLQLVGGRHAAAHLSWLDGGADEPSAAPAIGSEA